MSPETVVNFPHHSLHLSDPEDKRAALSLGGLVELCLADRSITQSSFVLSLAGWKSGDGPRVLSSKKQNHCSHCH